MRNEMLGEPPGAAIRHMSDHCPGAAKFPRRDVCLLRLAPSALPRLHSTTKRRSINGAANFNTAACKLFHYFRIIEKENEHHYSPLVSVDN